MKLFSLQLLTYAAIFFSADTTYAQSSPKPSTPFISKGSELTYKITEDRRSFNYIIRITKFSEQDGIAFSWRTDEAVPRSGRSAMPYSSLNTATSLLTSIPLSDESLGAGEARIFMSNEMTKNIYDHLAEFKIDGTKRSFIFIQKSGESKKISYNNNDTEVDYHSGEEVLTYIGVIDIGRLSLLGYYYNKGTTVDLISLSNNEETTETPVEKNQEKGKPRKMGTVDFIFAQLMFPTLSVVENFDPTDGGKIKQPFTETYDYRLESNQDLPPSYIDAFIVDLKYIYEHKAKFSTYITGDFKIGEKDLPDDEVLKVLNVYLNVNAIELYGYRPWANQQFVKSLSGEERTKLASEASSYIMLYGFKEK